MAQLLSAIPNGSDLLIDANVTSAQAVRLNAGLLKNDSIIVAAMREYGISLIATNDRHLKSFQELPFFLQLTFEKLHRACAKVAALCVKSLCRVIPSRRLFAQN